MLLLATFPPLLLITFSGSISSEDYIFYSLEFLTVSLVGRYKCEDFKHSIEIDRSLGFLDYRPQIADSAFYYVYVL